MRSVIMLKKANSADSWVLPWYMKKRKRSIVIVESQEQDKYDKAVSFILCFASVLLLAAGITLISLSIWSLVKKIPYQYLLDIKVDTAYFMLPAGLLLLPGFWVAASIHNNSPQYKFLHLLVVLLLASSSLLIIGSYFGIMYTGGANVTLTSSLENQELREVLTVTLYEYKRKSLYKYAWDTIQYKMECCGIDNSTDWDIIPDSCCLNYDCNTNITYGDGCLDTLSRDLVWHKNFLVSHCYMFSVVQLAVLIIACSVYICHRKK
ncbi:unnamed protein product [Acanthoscelides obtectus]|uniref:Tetraspanin n=1 Tax=Acanthoscelides obtectus TaxID=200917 RepID=A0A9P0KAK2_ACAOB|nr:unnamed protein product [Acanthoscelides obtectus]CAK1673437.1 hypothetical protein AOBTE_LOCUS29338 [Acanthoscelides obtectus]